MTDFLDSLNDELNAKQAEAERLTEQIRKLQEEKDRVLAIASRLDELIIFYAEREIPSILVFSKEVLPGSNIQVITKEEILVGIRRAEQAQKAKESIPEPEKVQEEVELHREEATVFQSRRYSASAPYAKFLNPEFKGVRLMDGALQILRQHPNELLELDAIARRLAKENLKREAFLKLKNAISGALGHAVRTKLCYRATQGVYTLKKENYK